MSFMKLPFMAKRCKRLRPSDYCKSRQRKGSTRRSSRSRRRSRKSSRRRSGGKKKRCARPGRVTKNPFFNYLREFRKKHCGWSITKVAVEGAKCWCSMDPKSKEKFYREACGQMGGRGRGKMRSRHSRSRSRHGRSRSRHRRSRSRRGKFRSCSCKGRAGKKGGRSRSSRGRKRGRNSKCL